MSSKVRAIGRKVKEQRNKMYMDNMYELFSLSRFQLLSLRRKYLRHMRRREKEQKMLARAIRRSYRNGKV